VHGDGTVVGRHKPSASIVHRAIYDPARLRRRQAHQSWRSRLSPGANTAVPQARHIAASRFAPYALPDAALAKNIADCVSRSGHRSVVLENHGVIVGGDDLARLARFETLSSRPDILKPGNSATYGT